MLSDKAPCYSAVLRDISKLGRRVRQPLFSWLLFAGMLLLAGAFWRMGWMYSWYTQGQIGLFLLTVGAAVFSIRATRRDWWVFLLVFAALVIANFGLVQRAIMFTAWSVRGFAP